VTVSVRRRKTDKMPKTPRGRPQLATTVAPETLAALNLLAGGKAKRGNVGTVVDRLFWAAVCQRLEAIAFGKPNDAANARDEPDVETVILQLLAKHKNAFEKLDTASKKRRATELQSAHDARVACGAWSSLDDFVALFVARRSCPAC